MWAGLPEDRTAEGLYEPLVETPRGVGGGGMEVEITTCEVTAGFMLVMGRVGIGVGIPQGPL